MCNPDSDFDDDVYEDVDIPSNQQIQIQPNFKEYIIKIPSFKISNPDSLEVKELPKRL